MKITHIMADGTKRDSIEGLVIPTTGVTESVYKMLASRVNEEREQSDEANKKDARG